MKKILIFLVFINITIFGYSQSNYANGNGTIEDISIYIFKDLRLRWRYNNLEDLLEILNISENYSIRKSSVKNTIHSGKGFLEIYHIESKNYEISITAFEEINLYYLNWIELEINENNYLNLFPYKNIKDYMEDKDFGEIVGRNTEKNNIYYIMRYRENTDLGYCNLLFFNELLKSIRIIAYTP
jgi:hypothetical protein